MKTVLALVVAVAAIGLHVSRNVPEVNAMVSGKVPALDSLLEPPQTAERSRAKAMVVDKKLLVGAWQAQDNSELLFLREDGKARTALAGNFEATSASNGFRSATLTGVAMADWSLDGKRLRMELGEIQQFTVRKQKMDLESQPGFKEHPVYVSDWKSHLFHHMPKVLRRDFTGWAKATRCSSSITNLTEDTLVMERGGEPVVYKRVNPSMARDPDGTNAAKVDSRVTVTGSLRFTCGGR